MYLYLYDNFLRERQYLPLVRTMETRLTDMGIAGKILRLQPLTNTGEMIEDEVGRGVTTVVIVGDDATLGQVLSRAAGIHVLFGFLPFGANNAIAETLGIPVGIEACKTLSRRRKMRLDVGAYNHRWFISRLHIPPHPITVDYDGEFRVSSELGTMELAVCNLLPFSWKEDRQIKHIVVNPQDGKLEAIVRPLIKRGIFRERYGEPSVFPFRQMMVKSATPFVVNADGYQSRETRLTIRLAKEKVEMIVGKERKF